jgi:hypothetical protein
VYYNRSIACPKIRPPLYWDDDDNNINHLRDRHQVSTDEIEELIFGIDGEEPSFVMTRDGDGSPSSVRPPMAVTSDCTVSSSKPTTPDIRCSDQFTAWTWMQTRNVASKKDSSDAYLA